MPPLGLRNSDRFHLSLEKLWFPRKEVTLCENSAYWSDLDDLVVNCLCLCAFEVISSSEMA